MKYYLLTLIRVPVNLFPRVFYWKFHFYFMLFYFFFYQILEESVMSGGKILQYHGDLFSHIFGTSWVRECGCKLRNKRVQKPHCLSPPCPLLFFLSASLGRAVFPLTHGDLWARQRAAPQHTSSLTQTHAHTQVLRFRNAARVRPNFAALCIQKIRGRTRSSHKFPKRTAAPAIPSNSPKWITSL